ncbi:hypothetical protein KR222_011485 [Zaprionus bogoriensis]|nr:hypothetical protein KR222_011485 [Zaprionus bogoriensis]
MSWLSPRKQFYNLVCKVTPNGKTCRAHLMAEHPECFQNDRGHITYLLELPQNVWNRLVNGGERIQSLIQPRSSCPLYDEENQLMSTLFKVMFLIAISVGILYGILKMTSQRRASLQ